MALEKQKGDSWPWCGGKVELVSAITHQGRVDTAMGGEQGKEEGWMGRLEEERRGGESGK